jgi:iron complex outermembrane receptor protein
MRKTSITALVSRNRNQCHRALCKKKSLKSLKWAIVTSAWVTIVASSNTADAADPAQIQVLAELSIEELSNIQITSVAKHPERLADAPAAIFVITNDDIRRSGATSLPEALRLAPNLQVAEVENGQYEISARGFNTAFDNKLLVLIDGRTVYTPLYSGVNWDSQFVMLEDVDRIEVISGPGGTIWGANAVNGVINIITRSAEKTQGALIAAGDGNRSKGGSFRYGGKLGDAGNFRIYGTGFDSGNTTKETGRSAIDDWQTGQIGFRTDWHQGLDTFTFQGDAYRGKSDPDPVGFPRVSGDNLLSRWTRQFEDGSNFNLQANYQYTDNDDPFTFRDQEYIFDIEFQHSFKLWDTNKILWGAGYRFARDDTHAYIAKGNLLPEAFLPTDAGLSWRNLFIQDEKALTDKLTLTLGLKAETNVYTGAEYLPSIRLAYKPTKTELWWGEISRAVRAPARLDTDFYFYLHLPGRPLIPIIEGGPNFKSEVAKVLEVGYRAQPTGSLSYSITGFFNFYDDLRSGEPPPAIIQNMMEGSTYGFETWGSYQATQDWRLSVGWNELRENIRIEAGSKDPTGPSALGDDPHYQVSLRSAFNLFENQELDIALRRIGALPNPAVPAYTALDVRYAWKPRRDLELSLSAQNLLGRNHVEFGAAPSRVEIPMMVFAKMVLRY